MMERERERWRGGSSDVHPALLHDGRHPLLVLPLVFLIELCGLTVGRAVGVWLVQQRLWEPETGDEIPEISIVIYATYNNIVGQSDQGLCDY